MSFCNAPRVPAAQLVTTGTSGAVLRTAVALCPPMADLVATAQEFPLERGGVTAEAGEAGPSCISRSRVFYPWSAPPGLVAGYRPAMAPSGTGNRILEGLAPREMAILPPHLHELNIDRGAVLAEAGQPAPHLYFPIRCVPSLVGATGSQRAPTVGALPADDRRSRRFARTAAHPRVHFAQGWRAAQQLSPKQPRGGASPAQSITPGSSDDSELIEAAPASLLVISRRFREQSEPLPC